MQQIIDGKNYDTGTMTTLVKTARHNNGTYSGSDSIRITPGGAYAFVSWSNGQDMYRQSYIETLDKSEVAAKINGWVIDDNERDTLVAHGIIINA